MWPDQRSSTIRHLIPGAIIFIYLWYFKIYNIVDRENIFLVMVAIVSVVIGFILDVIVIPFSIGIIRKRWPSFELQHSRAPIQNLIDYELADIKELSLKEEMGSTLNSTSIFDAFMNEFEEDKVIDRLFFLFDLIHALKTVIVSTCAAIVIAVLELYDLSCTRCISTIIMLCLFAISCAGIYRRKLDQANNYEFSLTIKNFVGIWNYIKRIKCQRMLDILIEESREQNVSLGAMCTHRRCLFWRSF
jgi:hypothetical protein